MSEITKQDLERLEGWVNEGKDKCARAETLLASLKEQKEKEAQTIRDLGFNPDKADEELEKLQAEIQDMYNKAIEAKDEADGILANAGR
jgi:chromosome segregation ATPase